MPELPEVETVRRGLAPIMEGAVILRADVNRPDLRWPFPPDLAERLVGRRVLRLMRRSKYILAELDRAETLLIHLGMSGRILVSGNPLGKFVHGMPGRDRHDHVVLHLDSGIWITLNDPRRFGAVDLFPTDLASGHRLLAGLGPEPLGNAFSEAHLVRAFSGRSIAVKSALLDQRIVAGLGNIYVCESLFRGKIPPMCQAGRISPNLVGRLVPVIRAVLEEAIAAGGSSLRDFRKVGGELGMFQHRFDVYGREGQPCHRSECNGKVRRIVQSGRSTFYCPVCQIVG